LLGILLRALDAEINLLRAEKNFFISLRFGFVTHFWSRFSAWETFSPTRTLSLGDIFNRFIALHNNSSIERTLLPTPRRDILRAKAPRVIKAVNGCTANCKLTQLIPRMSSSHLAESIDKSATLRMIDKPGYEPGKGNKFPINLATQ
jgi:hypothetical protein